MKVQLYTRHNGSREYQKVSSKASFKGGNFPLEDVAKAKFAGVCFSSAYNGSLLVRNFSTFAGRNGALLAHPRCGQREASKKWHPAFCRWVAIHT
jgi:hypothetical protein